MYCRRISVCLFDLMLYLHGKQLRSCREDQLLNHTSWAGLPEAVYHYLVSILSPVMPAEEGTCFQRKNVRDARVDLGTAACESDSLPTELPHPAIESLVNKEMSTHCRRLFYRYKSFIRNKLER